MGNSPLQDFSQVDGSSTVKFAEDAIVRLARETLHHVEILLEPRNAVRSVKFVVSTTRVSPSQCPPRIPEPLADVGRHVRASIGGDDAHVVNHLLHDGHVSRTCTIWRDTCVADGLDGRPFVTPQDALLGENPRFSGPSNSWPLLAAARAAFRCCACGSMGGTSPSGPTMIEVRMVGATCAWPFSSPN